MTAIINQRYLVVFLLMLILTVPFLNRGLYETSEGRYARVAQQMILENNYLMPKLNGQSHLTKPPLAYWTIATGLSLFGNSSVGARIFHSLAWIIIGLIIVRIGGLLEGPQLGLVAGLVFASGFFPSFGAWGLTTDQLLVFFQAFSLLAFLRFQKEKDTTSAFIFWVAVGLSLLTKGPVALIPVIFWGIFWKENFKSILRTNLWPVCIIIGFSWYIILEVKNPGIILKLIHEELILRSTTNLSGRNPFWWAPFVVYFLPFLLGWGLWPILFRKERIRHLKQRFPYHWTSLMVIWIGLSLILFSFIQSRLTLYILPLSIPASLLVAYVVKDSHHVLKVCLTNAILIFLLKGYGTYLYQSDNDSLQISEFIHSNANNAKVYSLWEKSLFGVEFYLRQNYIKVIEPTNYHFPTESSFWVIYQKKREPFFSQLCESGKLIPKETKVFGKWHLTKIASD